MKTIAAIPCFNTAPFIAHVVSGARRYVDQVVVVDDGSTDGTAEAARAAGALVISHSTNRGYGEAIKSCFGAAKANSADILVILDGDEQHNPDEIPQLLAPILQGEADLVIGSRFLQPTQPTKLTQPSQLTQLSKLTQPSQPSQPSQLTKLTKLSQPTKLTVMPRYRKFGIGVITWLFNLGSRTKVSDAQCGFRAYGKKVLDALSLTEKGMGISVETIIKACEAGFIIKEVPLCCLYHPGSSSRNPVIHGLSVALTVIKLRLKSSLHNLIGAKNA